MNTQYQNIWIVGCGDMGCRLADLYQKQGVKTYGIVKRVESVHRCQQHGVSAMQVRLDKAYSLPADSFEQADVYYFVPPPAKGTQDSVLQYFLAKLGDLPRRIVLISTTGVYGDSKGAWVDESTPVNPKVERAKRRYSAEQSLRAWAIQHDREYMILRVPGIYALDRLPLARLQKGLPVVNENEAGWTNRIHADDLARIAKAAMEIDLKNRIYNTSDGHPGTMTRYFNQVADYLGLARPPQIDMKLAEQTLSPGMVSYLRESRRVCNDKMLTELNITLDYPDLEATLNSAKTG